MTFKEFSTRLAAARSALRELKGDREFPGLGRYDRIYELPPNCHGWPATAIVRASAMSDDVDERVPIDVWIWSRSGHEAKFDELTADQHAKIAEIQRSVTLWIRGEIETLPPSTDRNWKHP